MKNILVLLFVLFALQTQAQTEYINDEVKSQLAVEFYTSQGFKDYHTGFYDMNTYEPVTTSFGSGLGAGIRYGRMISSKFQLSIGAYYKHSFLNYQSKYFKVNIDRFNFNPNLRYFINLRNKRSRFLFGAGLLISVGTTYKLKSMDPYTLSEDFNFKYKPAFGATAEFGYELFATQFLSFDFVLKYDYLKYSLQEAKYMGSTVSISDVENSVYQPFVKPDAQAIGVVIGAKYCF